MKKTYYEKRGRRYVPVAEYDSNLFDSMHKGTHLVMCYPGGHSVRYDIDPAYAALIAAGRVAENAVCDALREAGKIAPKQNPLTEEQHEAYRHLLKTLGEDAYSLQIESTRGVAEAGVQAMQKEAEKLLTNSAVRLAYEHFLRVAELSKAHNE
jgi:hypothetical protein